MYDDLFGRFNQTVAQLLLTKNDLAHRTQYLNAVNCIEELLDMGVIPIVNENDTISYSVRWRNLHEFKIANPADEGSLFLSFFVGNQVWR
jgi:nanoRNase/pAp phosphatase (c-di-AMP/oligoRNAs hydrolase)